PTEHHPPWAGPGRGCCAGQDGGLQRSAKRRVSLRQAQLWLPTLSQWTNSQISDHYSTCIKLSTENKITTRNAFGLHLIDYITDILKQKDSEVTNFKVAAGTLDASAKIYSVRVDAVHTDTYKVLGGLGTDLAPAKPTDSSEEGVSLAVKRVQTKKKHSFKTIEQNLNNINASETNHRCEIDPMFQKTASSFDECSTAGIFLTGLRTQSCQSELLFDLKIVPLPSSETVVLPNSDPVKVMDLKSLLAQCIEKRLICSSLADFQFTKWDAESHEESVAALLDKFKKSNQVFDINAEIDSDVEDCVPVLPDDDFNSDSPRSAVAEKIGEFSENLNSIKTGDIGTMCLHLSMKPGEYSYFSPRILSMWAGPEHWRFKPQHKSDGNSEKETKKRNVKKAFEINFDEDIDFDTYFRKTKASITLAKSILESQNVKSTTLPTDFNYDPKNIIQLFLKPAVKVGDFCAQGVGTCFTPARHGGARTRPSLPPPGSVPRPARPRGSAAPRVTFETLSPLRKSRGTGRQAPACLSPVTPSAASGGQVEEAADPVGAPWLSSPLRRQRVPQFLLQHLEDRTALLWPRARSGGRAALQRVPGWWRGGRCGATHLLASHQPLLPGAELHGVLLVQPPQLPPLLLCQEVHLLPLGEERWKGEGGGWRRGNRGGGGSFAAVPPVPASAPAPPGSGPAAAAAAATAAPAAPAAAAPPLAAASPPTARTAGGQPSHPPFAQKAFPGFWC
uniref:Condensin complex subunit 2 n=1 Tax=Athene cunicularia TaxID=194338 RepID=A0A663M9S0_ATHCN